MNIKAAIFDMDGTLVDSLMVWDVLWSTLGEKYLNDDSFSPSAEDDKTVRTLTLRDAMHLIHRNYQMGESGDELHSLASGIMRDFYASRVELKQGVMEFLEYCSEHNVKMCIASATAPELVEVAVRHCGIEKYFMKIFSCSNLGKGKEKPDIFLVAKEFLGEKTENIWVFEDSLTAIETASGIGMNTVGIYDRFNYGQERIREIATEYIAEGETLLRLIDSKLNFEGSDMDEIFSAEVQREIGKHYFFYCKDDEEKRNEGLRLLVAAQKQGDPEAMYIVGRLILDSVLGVNSGDPEDFALRLLCASANGGWLQARNFLNSYCEQRYERDVGAAKKEGARSGPLVGFDGRVIKVDRKGVFSPIDALLEYKDGKNVLTLSTNVAFCYVDDIPNSDRFEEAILEGLLLWEGEYEVFNGQRVTVELQITTDQRIFDNLFVMPITDDYGEMIKSAGNVVLPKNLKAKIDNVITNKRSFASGGLKWSVNSRKLICIQSPSESFDDYEEMKHVAKHEFGHALGLGDLYESKVDSYMGVERGRYIELDSYAICDRYYNLVMCDHHGPISNNDIEMVILAFSENSMQLFQPGGLRGKISSALGKGN